MTQEARQEMLKRFKVKTSDSPQFRILSDEKLAELHSATLRVLEKTGVAFECPEAIELLGNAGADVSKPERVKIPSRLVESALETSPKSITIYTREGEIAFVLDGTETNFGPAYGHQEHLDPYTRKRRLTYVDDIASTARLVDALPNLNFQWTSTANLTLPGNIADKVTAMQALVNSSKPLGCILNDIDSVKEIVRICSIIAGGEKQFRQKPFIFGSQEPATPLIQGKEPMEKSLLLAEMGIPNVINGCQLAGATTPATKAAELVIANAEVLSHIVVIQLKKPGAPVIYGNMPSIMDMRTGIFCFGAPELALNVAAMTELSRYYHLPAKSFCGCTDADAINAQTAAEVAHQILLASLSGADIVNDIGMMYHCTTQSPELMVLCNELIDMAKVTRNGIQVNQETLALDLIDRIGPRGSYILEKHTLDHFREFWMPTIFDRSVEKRKGAKSCDDLLNERTIEIIEHHQPKALPADVLKEIKKSEVAWLKSVGLRAYPKQP